MARELAEMSTDKLTVQSCATRFGSALADPADLPYDIVRNLPEPAGEAGGRSGALNRWAVAARRSRLRGRLLETLQPDLVHLHTYNPFTDWYAVRNIVRRYPVVVQSIHNVRPHSGIRPHWVETGLLMSGYRPIPHIVVAHDLLKTSLVGEFGIDPARVTVVPLPIVVPNQSDERPRVHSDELRLLLFGTLRTNKGLPVLLEAVRRLPAGTNVHLTIAGRGDAKLEDAAVDAARRDPRISAEIGFVQDQRKYDLYRGADLVLLPYEELNAQSGVLSDAYGHGLPVIVSDVPTLAATINQDGTGWVVRRGDAEALAVAILRACAEPNRRTEYGARAAAVAVSRSPEKIAERLLGLYSVLVENRRGLDGARPDDLT